MHLSRFDVCCLMGLEYRAWVFLRVNSFFLFLGEFEGVIFLLFMSLGGWGVGGVPGSSSRSPLGGGMKSPTKLSIQGLSALTRDVLC